MKAEIINHYPIEFYGSRFLVFLTDKGKLVLPILHMCEILGLDYSAEIKRIRSLQVLREKLYEIYVPFLVETGQAKDEDLRCITIDCLPFWVSRIETSKVRKRAKAKIIAFQRGIREALWLMYCSEILPDELISDLGKIKMKD